MWGAGALAMVDAQAGREGRDDIAGTE